MKLKIYSRFYLSKVVYEGEAKDIKQLLIKAVGEGADLRGANLRGADLEKCKTPPTESHEFISEILFRNSENIKHRQWAGLVKISLDWCWNDFFEKMPKTAIKWAGKILCGLWPDSFDKKFNV